MDSPPNPLETQLKMKTRAGKKRDRSHYSVCLIMRLIISSSADNVFFYINYLHTFEITLYGQHAAIVVSEKLHILGTSIFSFYSVYIYFYGKQFYRLYCDHIESHCLQP